MHKKFPLLFVAFLEGFCVILIELTSGRIVAPIFGTALQVWAGVLGITLFGLASGYLFGSRLNFNKKNTLIYLIGSAAIYVALFTFFSETILFFFSNLSYELGLILSLTTSLFVPLTLLGAVTPFLSDRLSSINGQAGKATGIVFSISTFGGIAGAFVTGFLFIPQLGIIKTMYIAALALGLIVLFIIIIQSEKKRMLKVSGGLLILIFCASQIGTRHKIDNYSGVKLRYENENMLSQLRILDVPSQQSNGDLVTFRMMMVNNTLQAIVDANNPSIDFLQFSRLMDPLISTYFQNKRILILGLGGGVIANKFIEANCEVDIVEIDSRVFKMAKQYFGLSNSVNVFIEDARRFVTQSNKKYDVIFIDTFHGESIPSHVFTKEALQEMHQLLAKDGVLISNFHGFTDAKRGIATAAVYKTLKSVGFKNKILVSNTNDDEMRSLLFLSSINGFDSYTTMDELEVKNLTYKSGLDGTFADFTIDPSKLELNKAPILVDDKQQLDYLLKEVSLEWRLYCYDKFVKMNGQLGIPLIQ